jgi:FkbM family methyltransferase
LATWNRIIDTFNIDLVLDVGANRGQFARELRAAGYAKKIISFEPLASAYKELARAAAYDRQWETKNCAIGDFNGQIEINIAGNSFSSSIRPMLPSHLEALPVSAYVAREQVPISTLDTIFEQLNIDSNSIFLKIDTQGFEKNVLDGAQKSLQRIATLQLEMSLVQLYDGETLFVEMYQLLYGMGYRLVSIMEGFTNRETAQLLQVDGLFHRY